MPSGIVSKSMNINTGAYLPLASSLESGALYTISSAVSFYIGNGSSAPTTAQMPIPANTPVTLFFEPSTTWVRSQSGSTDNVWLCKIGS